MRMPIVVTKPVPAIPATLEGEVTAEQQMDMFETVQAAVREREFHVIAFPASALVGLRRKHAAAMHGVLQKAL
jgi:hypothetical protein